MRWSSTAPTRCRNATAAASPPLTVRLGQQVQLAPAVGAEAARRIPVPERMSVAGFDDVSVAADLAPSLTTVRLPMTGMGRMALEPALKPPSGRPRRRPTGHTLMIRDSTGPAPRTFVSEDKSSH
ncbi:substrate-binding domain-containing protein [Actinoplanes sp. NPDC049316]|uniref:substrate-binding domain-containing protein n=1 Tax=Actinoplanes sp. NPDC049316 TaxID=3154727 RepID=UPI003421B897